MSRQAGASGATRIPVAGEGSEWGMKTEVNDAQRSASLLFAALLAAVLVNNVAAASPAVCNMRLSVELTPDVPNPGS